MALIQKSVPLHQQVYQVLKEKIIQGEYMPREKLVELRISSELGVSRSPIREALRKLEQEGLIEQKQNQLFVKQYSAKEVIDVYQCRKALESMAASLVVNTITEADQKVFVQILEDTRQSLIDNDQQEIINNNTKFHKKLVTLSNNSALIDVLDGLESKILFYRNTIFRKYFRDASFLEEHEEIFRAVISGDRNKAKQAMEKHIDADIKAFSKHMKTTEFQGRLQND